MLKVKSNSKSKVSFRNVKKSIISASDKTQVENYMVSQAKRGVLARAASIEINKQHKEGLSVTIALKGVIYKVHPNGTKEVISNVTSKAKKINKRTLTI
jgi:hypothetical protein